MLAFVASIILLLAVLVVGRSGNGAQRWIQLGPLTIQPSEIAKMADSTNCELAVNVADVTKSVAADTVSGIAAKAAGYTVAQYVDISLNMQFVRRGKLVEGSERALTDMGSKLAVEIVVPADSVLINTDEYIKREYAVVREHNGAYELLTAEFDAATRTLKFESDKFSVFAIAYKDTEIPKPSPTVLPTATPTATPVPTITEAAPVIQDEPAVDGGSVLPFVIIGIVAVAVIAVVVVVVVKKKK